MKFFVLASFAGSLSNFRSNLLKALSKIGEVHAAAPDLLHDSSTVQALAHLGGECHDVPLIRTGLNPLQDSGTLFATVRLLRKVRPTHFLPYTIKPVIYGTLAAWLAGAPRRTVLITGLGYAFNAEEKALRGALRALLRLMYKMALNRATRVVFQNPDDRALFIRLGLVDPEQSGYQTFLRSAPMRVIGQSIYKS